MSKEKNLQDERRELMKEVLDLFDPNNDGYVKSKDISKILKAMGRTLENEDEQNFLEAADPDQTGVISKDNFLDTFEAMYSLTKEKINEVLDAFKVFDINNTGKISVNNFKKVLVNFAHEFNEDEVNEIMKYINVDRDGNINIKDFVQVWKFQ